MLKNILLASDGSACAVCATETAALLAKQSGAKLTLITVFPDLIPALGVVDVGLADQYLEAQEGAIKVEYAEVVRKAQAIIGQYGVPFAAQQCRGSAADEIVAVADRLHADLIIVGHRGLNALQTMILGSTSERVVHRAHCSVLVVRKCSHPCET